MADEQTPLLNNYLEQERDNGMNIQQERYGVFEQYTEFNLDARLYATVLIEQSGGLYSAQTWRDHDNTVKVPVVCIVLISNMQLLQPQF